MMGGVRKMPFIIAGIFLTIGILLFVGVMSVNDWDFGRIGESKFVTNSYDIEENFDSIFIDGSTEDIVFLPTTDGKCRVECVENVKRTHTVDADDGVLKIVENDNSSWLDNIILSFKKSKITVYLPAGTYEKLTVNSSTGDATVPSGYEFSDAEIKLSTGDVSFAASVAGELKITLSTGDITVGGADVGSLDLKASTGDIDVKTVACSGDVKIVVTTGDVDISGLTCKNLASEGSTGDITLTDVIVNEKIAVTRSTGDVTFVGSDASEIFVKASTGAVTGTLLSGKVFKTHTSTGKITVPTDTYGAGKCEISTSTGRINISVK